MDAIYEAQLTIVCSKDLHFSSAHEEIGKVIARTMVHHPRLKQLHGENRNKLYVFSNLSPIERDGVYKKGNVYQLTIRSSDRQFLLDFQTAHRTSTPSLDSALHILHIEMRKLQKRFIHALYTLNPLIVTIDSGPWKLEHGLLLLQKRIQANAERKYGEATGTSLRDSPSFIEHIEILTEKPYAYRYKGRKFLAHKVRVMVRPDNTSQALAQVILGCGMGEKGSSLGAGFCHASYL